MTDYFSNSELAKRGQDAALAFLQQQGFRLVQQNFLCRYGELDLVVKSPDTVVFVEVKTRRKQNEYAQTSIISQAKIKRMSTAAKIFITQNSAICQDKALRFDVIIIIFDDIEAKIQHLPNAFYAP